MSERVIESAADDPAIRRAEEIVGWNQAPNRSLHADEFEQRHLRPLRCFLPDSQPLIDCLTQQSVQTTIERYNYCSDKAGRAQRNYVLRSKCMLYPIWSGIAFSLVLVFFTARQVADFSATAWCLSATWVQWASGVLLSKPLSLAQKCPTEAWVNEIELSLLNWLPWLIVASLVLTPAIGLLYSGWDWCTGRDPYTEWKVERGTAETLRREFFQRILDAKPTAAEGRPSDPWLLLLKLEYFRRWQAEVQREYFKGRGTEHNWKVRKSKLVKIGYIISWLGLAFLLGLSRLTRVDEQGLSGLPLGVTGRLSALGWTEDMGFDYVLTLAGLGAVLALAYVFYDMLLGESVRNGARYDKMLQNFETLLGNHLRTARFGAARGRAASVREFVRRVHAIMSIELSDWVRLADLDQGKETALTQPADEGVR